MDIVRLRANRLENPIGYDLSGLSLSWVAQNTEAKKQESAEIVISKCQSFDKESIVYKSGIRKDADSRSFVPELMLEPRTRYYWKVKVVAAGGESAESETAFFETGKLDEEWKAEWITAEADKNVHPYLRKSFVIDGDVKSARAYVSAAGIYEMELNGEKISSEYLMPGYSAYDCWMQYQTFDVTESIKKGENAVGAILGKGWFSGRFGLGGIEETYGDRMAFLCEIIVETTDGEKVVIVSDESWKSHQNPVTHSNIYDGEHYDANLEIDNWSKADCDDENWSGVSKIDLNIGPMSERLNPPILKHESFKPIDVISTPKGETVLDFGQNMAGWVEFDADIPKNEKVFLQYGELMQDGCFYRENLRSAKAEYEYISKGEKAHVRPHFTFYGFRYVKVEGMEVNPDDFTAYAIYSKMDELCEITTSSELVNRLILNAKWGQKGNFLDVPTDCPQRDERLGWTGDAQIFSGTACYFTDTAAFYNKYLKDMRQEQLLLDGSVPIVVPRVKNQQDIGEGHGSCAWSDAATIIPWNVYLFYGDKSLLEKHYDSMKDWVDYVKRQDEADGGKRLWQTGMHIADWLALDNPDPEDIFTGGTDPYYVASAYYYYSVKLTADAAEALGKAYDAKYYRELQEEIKESFRKEYFTPNGKIAIDTQTAHVVALFMDLVKDEHKERVISSLKEKLTNKGGHLDTGFVGTGYICRALSKSGASEYAYKLLLNDDFPSWLYQVKMGATTIWERWNSVNPDGHVSSTGMNSMNHYSYGSVAEWIARDVCGLNPVLSQPGFKRALISPKPYGYLSSASIKYESVSGTYSVGWKMEDSGKVDISFKIPFDCSAEIILPDTKAENITVAGQKPLSVKEKDGCVILEAEAGKLSVSYVPDKSYIPYYSLNSTLNDIFKSEKATEVLNKYLSDTIEGMKKFMPGMLEKIGNKPLTYNPIFGLLARLGKENTEALACELSKVRFEAQ